MFLMDAKCRHYYKPAKQPLDLLQAKDTYESVAEGYVRCFWGLCDQHSSVDRFTSGKDAKVITQQPTKHGLALRTPGIIQNVLISNYK